ncbi:clasp N terminal-domain-containing protein [Paraphysoderma sedebokerense]|nr:clasp N terminal-domain-containing protein [Paraphysoderma sedebokerense]
MAFDSIPLRDAADLDKEFKSLCVLFQDKESEHTWELFDTALRRLGGLLRGGANNFDAFLPGIKALKQPICNSMLTERTRLSGTACELVDELAKVLGPDFESLSEAFIPTLLKICVRTNKVFITRASNALKSIIRNCNPYKHIPKFCECMKNSSKSLRAVVIELIHLILDTIDSDILEDYVDVIEVALKDGLSDSSPVVRDWSKKIYELYRNDFGDRVERFLDSLPITTKKNLNVTKPPPKPRINFRQFRNERSKSQDDVVLVHLPARPGPGGMGKSTSIDNIASNIKADVKDEYGNAKPIKKDSTQFLAAQMASILSVVKSDKSKGIDQDRSVSSFKPDKLPKPFNQDNSGESFMKNSLTSYSENPMSAAKPKIAALRVEATPFQARRMMTKAARIPEGMKLKDGQSGEQYFGGAKRIRVAAQEEHLPESSLTQATGAPRVLSKVKPVRITDQKPAAAQVAENNPSTSTEEAGLTKPKVISRKSTTTSQEPDESNSAAATTSAQTTASKMDINAIISNTKNSDWSIRLRAFETLGKILSSDLESESKSRIQKIIDVHSTALSDSHFKILQVALDNLSRLTSKIVLLLPDVETILAKTFNIVHNHQFKSKKSILEVANKVINNVKKSQKPEILLISLFHILNRPEHSSNNKIKAGVVSVIAELLPIGGATFLEKQNLRVTFSRLASLLSDSEPSIKRDIKRIFFDLYTLKSDQFFGAVVNLKPEDRKVLKTMLMKSIKHYDKLEDEALSALKNAKDSKYVRSKTPKVSADDSSLSIATAAEEVDLSTRTITIEPHLQETENQFEPSTPSVQPTEVKGPTQVESATSARTKIPVPVSHSEASLESIPPVLDAAQSNYQNDESMALLDDEDIHAHNAATIEDLKFQTPAPNRTSGGLTFVERTLIQSGVESSSQEIMESPFVVGEDSGSSESSPTKAGPNERSQDSTHGVGEQIMDDVAKDFEPENISQGLAFSTPVRPVFEDNENDQNRQNQSVPRSLAFSVPRSASRQPTIIRTPAKSLLTQLLRTPGSLVLTPKHTLIRSITKSRNTRTKSLLKKSDSAVINALEVQDPSISTSVPADTTVNDHDQFEDTDDEDQVEPELGFKSILLATDGFSNDQDNYYIDLDLDHICDNDGELSEEEAQKLFEERVVTLIRENRIEGFKNEEMFLSVLHDNEFTGFGSNGYGMAEGSQELGGIQKDKLYDLMVFIRYASEEEFSLLNDESQNFGEMVLKCFELLFEANAIRNLLHILKAVITYKPSSLLGLEYSVLHTLMTFWVQELDIHETYTILELVQSTLDAFVIHIPIQDSKKAVYQCLREKLGVRFTFGVLNGLVRKYTDDMLKDVDEWVPAVLKLILSSNRLHQQSGLSFLSKVYTKLRLRSTLTDSMNRYFDGSITDSTPSSGWTSKDLSQDRNTLVSMLLKRGVPVDMELLGDDTLQFVEV